jgi:hypothetical protein
MELTCCRFRANQRREGDAGVSKVITTRGS